MLRKSIKTLFKQLNIEEYLLIITHIFFSTIQSVSTILTPNIPHPIASLVLKSIFILLSILYTTSFIQTITLNPGYITKSTLQKYLNLYISTRATSLKRGSELDKIDQQTFNHTDQSSSDNSIFYTQEDHTVQYTSTSALQDLAMTRKCRHCKVPVIGNSRHCKTCGLYGDFI